MKYLLILLIITLVHPESIGQTERKFVRQGNRYYLEGKKDTLKLDTISFSKAETEYRKALDKKPTDSHWNFNLNNAIYKQTKFDEAARGFEQLATQATDTTEKARAYHNLGNSLLFQEKIDESIEAYKKALRNNPRDIETKYNLAYAQRLKQQQQNQDQNKDQNKDQNQDQKQDPEKQNQNQDQNKENQQQQQQPPPKISRQNAEQLLQALQNDEKNIQDKVKKAQAAEVKATRVEKDW
jgi:tetratricopeptide (TPR) repeat protein